MRETSLLGRNPAQMGVLNAAAYLPFLLLALVAGAWVDRKRRRPISVAPTPATDLTDTA